MEQLERDGTETVPSLRRVTLYVLSSLGSEFREVSTTTLVLPWSWIEKPLKFFLFLYQTPGVELKFSGIVDSIIALNVTESFCQVTRTDHIT